MSPRSSAGASVTVNPEVDAPPAANLGWALGMVLRRWHERVEHALGDLPQGPRGFHVLSAVVHQDLPTQAALASHLAIDRTVMTYLIDELEEAGLVERTPDPHDRRARRIVATVRGRKVLVEAERQVAAVEEFVFRGLAPEDKATFLALTQRTANLIREEDPTTDPCVAVKEVLDLAEGPNSRR
jgi:MarR family transcriptional regulator for hemolysin